MVNKVALDGRKSDYSIQFFKNKDVIYQKKGSKEVRKCSGIVWDEDDEFVRRMLKALKHLAYLANEKRSKSKF